MAQSAPEARRYFLGIQGNQSGPFSEEDVLGRIREKQVPPDALIWYEGLPDWQPIATIEYFRGAFSGEPVKPAALGSEVETHEFSRAVAQLSLDASAEADLKSPDPVVPDVEGAEISQPGSELVPSEEAAPASRPAAPEPYTPSYTPSDAGGNDAFSFANGALEPVFKSEDAKFNHGSGGGELVEKLKAMGPKLVIGGGVLAALGAAFAGYFWWSSQSGVSDKQPKPKVAKSAAGGIGARDVELSKALSQLSLTPEQALPALKKIAADSTSDKAGKEAMQAVVDYYKQVQRPAEAAHFLMSVKHPAEALPLFLVDPPVYGDAEKAAFAAYQSEKGDQRRDYIVQDINLLVGPLHDEKTAVERIRTLEKDFPGVAHPFGYYLKSTDDKIGDLFSRISFTFVQSLIDFLGTEFPQISFVRRPLVEVRRGKSGNYRIVATYDGEVTLNMERMNNTRMVFWLVGEQWVMVDTNLTPERKKFADAHREKYKNEEMSADKMLAYLQTLFKRQFPKNNFHEAVSYGGAPKRQDF